jgi:hypothetical protein
MIIVLTKDYAVAQLVQALPYEPEGRGIDFPMESLGFFNDLFLPAALRFWGSTQKLTEKSTRYISWGSRRPIRTADKLATFVRRLSRNSVTLKLLQP